MKDDTKIDDTKKDNRSALSGWEDEGGAARVDRQPTPAATPQDANPVASERRRLDASHASDARGEHRYPDAHQTVAEREARRKRDDLKRQLAGSASPRPGRTK